MITKIDIERFGLFSNYYWKQHILYTHGLGFSDWSGSGSSLLPDLGTPPMTSLPPGAPIASLMLMLLGILLILSGVKKLI